MTTTIGTRAIVGDRASRDCIVFRFPVGSNCYTMRRLPFLFLNPVVVIPHYPLLVNPRLFMSKRTASVSSKASSHPSKKARPDTGKESGYIKVATAENAAAVDKNPPLLKLRDAIKLNVEPKTTGSAVVYWMRMEDLRSMLFFQPLVQV